MDYSGEEAEEESTLERKSIGFNLNTFFVKNNLKV